MDHHFSLKKWEGWEIQLGPCHIWIQGQSQWGMAQAQSAACRALSSSLGSAKSSSTQLSLIPMWPVPSCQINKYSAENGHLFAVWCKSFSFSTHPKHLLTSEKRRKGEKRWGQEENQGVWEKQCLDISAAGTNTWAPRLTERCNKWNTWMRKILVEKSSMRCVFEFSPEV